MADIEEFEPLCEDISLSLQDIKDKLDDMRNREENSKLRKEISKAIADTEKSLNRFNEDLATVGASDEKDSLQKKYNRFTKLLSEYKNEFQNLKEGKKTPFHSALLEHLLSSFFSVCFDHVLHGVTISKKKPSEICACYFCIDAFIIYCSFSITNVIN